MMYKKKNKKNKMAGLEDWHLKNDTTFIRHIFQSQRHPLTLSVKHNDIHFCNACYKNKQTHTQKNLTLN